MPDPKKYEISEAEFLQNQQLRATVGKILANPKAKKKVLEAQRIIDPNVAAPELDEEVERNKPIEDLNQKFSELSAQLAKDKEDREAREKLSGLQSKQDQGFDALRRQKWTDVGIEGVKKYMAEKGILDPMDAATLWLRDNPPPAPLDNVRGSGSWDFMALPTEGAGAADLKALVETKGQSEPILNKMIGEALKEVRSQGR